MTLVHLSGLYHLQPITQHQDRISLHSTTVTISLPSEAELPRAKAPAWFLRLQHTLKCWLAGRPFCEPTLSFVPISEI